MSAGILLVDTSFARLLLNLILLQDKDKLTSYRKLIEQRMEQFKDIERENKTKPHSKQGLSAEEKLDPREKEKSDTVEWLQVSKLLLFKTSNVP